MSPEPLQRGRQAFEAIGELQRRLDQTLDRRPRLGLQAVAIVGEHRPRQHLLADQHEKLFEALVSAPFGNPPRPVVGREDTRGGENVDQRLGADFVAFYEIADPSPQTSRARPSAAFGADDPAAQLAPFPA